MHLPDQRIILTGGAGFLGRALAAALAQRGVPPQHVFVPRSRAFDLTRQDAVRRLFAEAFPGRGPTLVLHAAGFTGGIGRNRRHPARFFYDNLIMALNLVEEARASGFNERGGKFVQVGTMTSYPSDAPQPLREESLWGGYPDKVSAPYGVAKLACWQLLEAYHSEHGLKGSYLVPVNLYGPGDNVADPENSHVAGALVRKFVEAVYWQQPEVVCWGSGSPTRDFIFVDDAAEGVLRAAEVMERPDPINLGSGAEVSIRALAETIARLAGYSGRIVWDASRPDGQPRRCMDVSRARALLGWAPVTPLIEGLRRTVEWYRASLAKNMPVSGAGA